MERLFGTDGVRGVANVEPMTAEIAMGLGRAIAYLCRSHEGRHRIVVGKDTRLSGYMLENAMVAGICSMGVDVLVRYSGTEPLLRVMIEGPDHGRIREYADQIVAVARQELC